MTLRKYLERITYFKVKYKILEFKSYSNKLLYVLKNEVKGLLGKW